MRTIEDYVIKIEARDFNKNPIAIVTLTIEERFEIRFAPIYWKNKKSEIFFTLPSLGVFGFKRCVVLLDKAEYCQLSVEVLKKFKEVAHEKYTREQIELLDRLIDERIKLINETPSDI